ncbi:leukotriene A-4 hydrolase-like [Anneissia japonica]|uniref:leukotriene A-4 hydrolase-like n=1 Tax=Anneissia japonica TaxID=1529436 RepID=UPI0014258F9A|nr:leukotriene A-4 hydrolase-like [Anneissia japonica]
MRNSPFVIPHRVGAVAVLIFILGAISSVLINKSSFGIFVFFQTKPLNMGRVDSSSLSSPDKIITTNIKLTWDVDFTEKSIKGSAILDVKTLEDSVTHLVLDTRSLTIHSVTDFKTGQKLDFNLKEEVKPYGWPLEIKLPTSAQQKGSTAKISVEYATSPNASALAWMEPEQTSGRKHPYLYSQCQAIHARSIVPCQDTPAIKITYQADVTVPHKLTALMSATRLENQLSSRDGAKRIFKFHQTVPIPSYLFAIVVGALESRKIGPRTSIWSEADIVDIAAAEFEDTEKMLVAAESIAGPYNWDQYDLLVLPPSFPFGGMENPCLTFVTPTLLAGDKSLANVIAHEIAHSWTGNLVTNLNWNHFWLNEGHTVFLERKIIAKLNDEQTRHFHAIGGWKDLINSVKEYGEEHEFTKLIPFLEGSDPDDSFSSVPYEKGHTFLFYLETLVGGPEAMDGFLKHYIATFALKSIDTDQWKECFLDYFQKKVPSDAFDGVDWDTWFFKPGMPPVKPDYDTTLADACTELCELWDQASEDDLGGFSKTDIEDFSALQIKEFLGQLLQKDPLPISHILAMDNAYQLSASHNSEIKFKWLELQIKSEHEPVIQPALDFVNIQGRMKFVRPIYRELYAYDKASDKAVANFKEQEKYMHPITRSMVAKDLNLE